MALQLLEQHQDEEALYSYVPGIVGKMVELVKVKYIGHTTISSGAKSKIPFPSN